MKPVNLQYWIACVSWIQEISFAGCTFQIKIVSKRNDKFMGDDRIELLATKNVAERSATLIMICDPPLIIGIQLSYQDQMELYRLIPAEELNHVIKKYRRMNQNITEHQRRERLMLTSDSTWSYRHTILEWMKSSGTLPLFNVLILKLLNELPSISELHFKWDEGSDPTLISTSCEDHVQATEIYGFRYDKQFDYMWQTSDGRMGPIRAVVSSKFTTRNVFQFQDQYIYFHYGRIWSFIPQTAFEFLMKAFREVCPGMDPYNFDCTCSRLNEMPSINFEFIRSSFSGETSSSSESRSIRESRIFTDSEYVMTKALARANLTAAQNTCYITLKPTMNEKESHWVISATFAKRYRTTFKVLESTHGRGIHLQFRWMAHNVATFSWKCVRSE